MNIKHRQFDLIFCWAIVAISSLGKNFFSFRVGGITFGNERIGFIFVLVVELLYCLLHRDFKIRFNHINFKYIKFMLIWLIYGTVNVIFVRDFENYIRNIEMLLQGLVLCIIFIKHLHTYDDIIAVMNGFITIGFVHNIIGWYEFITGKYLFVLEERAWMFRRWSNPVSSYGNCNDYATFLFLVVIIGFYLSLYYARKKRRIISLFYIVVCISSIALIIFSGSRANILALMPAAFAGMFIYFKNNRTKRQVGFFLGFTSLAFIAIIYLVNRFGLLSQIDTIFNANGASTSNSGRINIYKNGLRFFVDSGFLGIGAGSADYWLINKAYYPVGVHKLHNWFLEILTCYGVVIFIPYAIYYSKLVLNGYRIVRNSVSQRAAVYYVESITVVFLIGYLLSGLSSGSNFTYAWIWVIWALFISAKEIALHGEGMR